MSLHWNFGTPLNLLALKIVKWSKKQSKSSGSKEKWKKEQWKFLERSERLKSEGSRELEVTLKVGNRDPSHAPIKGNEHPRYVNREAYLPQKGGLRRKRPYNFIFCLSGPCHYWQVGQCKSKVAHTQISPRLGNCTGTEICPPPLNLLALKFYFPPFPPPTTCK